MENLDVKKLSKDELKQIAFIRKFDDIPVLNIHFFPDDSVMFDFLLGGNEAFVDIYNLTSYVKKWIVDVWLEKFNKANDHVVIYDDNSDRSAMQQVLSEHDYKEFYSLINDDVVNYEK